MRRALGLAALSLTLSCSPAANRQAVYTALDTAEIACAVLQAELPIEEIKVTCRIVTIADEFLRQLVSSARDEKAARARDAGGP